MVSNKLFNIIQFITAISLYYKYQLAQVDALLKCIKVERTALGLPSHIVGTSSYGSELIV
ncbi:uncharacterized protein METZ01_LOCUS230698 [marine metagenome]|uniref:Uncharacterized protein n=1 Tax=marine metagenome TaxID=408172 RepID=A0A382GSN4_9ZZZZ